MPDHYWNAEPQLAHQYFIGKRKLPNVNCTLCDVQVCEHNDFAVSNICGKKYLALTLRIVAMWRK